MQVKWELSDYKNNIIKDNDNWDENELHVVIPLNEVKIKSLKAEVVVKTKKDEKVFMNGYQTWTVSKELDRKSYTRGVKKVPKFLLDKYSFDRYGDYHFIDYLEKKGISHGESYCYFRDGEKYRLFASLNEVNGYTLFKYDFNNEVLIIEKDCKDLKYNGEFEAFDLFYMEGSEDEVFDAWFKALKIKPRSNKRLFGYSSWYNRYQNIDEKTIKEDLDGCLSLFEKGDLFQIDDGWEMFIGDWLEPDYKKFPNGLKPMVDLIHEKGFNAGIWVSPFVAEENSKTFKEHPDWFLKVNGKPWKLGCNWSGFYSLDIDNPEVIEYIKKTLHIILDEWGFDLLKLDFLYGAAPFGNEKETRSARMIRGMKLLRELCGEKEILACGVPLFPCFGLVEYSRISCDVSLDWDDVYYMRLFHRERVSTKNAITNILTRRQLNNRAFINDPDVFFVRDKNIKLNNDQKDLLATLGILLGGANLTSDNPGEYSDEGIAKYKYYRNLAEAKDIKVNDLKEIEYTLNGQKHIRKIKR